MSSSFSLPRPIVVDIPVGHCDDPFNLSYKVEGNLVSLSWTSPHDNDGFYLRYWKTGESATQVTVFGSEIQIPLLPGVTYNWSVRTMCNRGGNVGSNTVIGPPFTTGEEGITCSTIDISAAMVIKTGKSARLEWTAVPGIFAYTLELKYGSAMPMSFDITNNYINLTILLPNTAYQWRVKPVCPNKVVNFSNWASFTTLLGDSCPPVDITGVVDVTTAIYYWTNCEAAKSYQVYLNGSLLAAEHPVNIITLNNLQCLTEYTLMVIPNCPEGPGELAYLTATTKDYPVKNPTDLVASFNNGNMIITWSPAEDITSQEIMINGSYEQLESDVNTYTIVSPAPSSKIAILIKSVKDSIKSPGAYIVGNTPGYCQPVKQLNLSGSSSSSIKLSWILTPGISKYRVRRRFAVGTTWVTDYTTSTEYTFKGLKANTDYIFEVVAMCGLDVSTAISLPVKTDPQPPCVLPVNLTSSAITDSSALIGFELADGKVPFDGQYTVVADDGANPVIYTTGSQSPLLLQGLSAFTDYTIFVANMCKKPDFNFPTNVSEPITIKTLKACGIVSSLAASLQSNNTQIFASWGAAGGVTGYTVFYRQLGALDWIEHSTSNTLNRTINITQQALYEVKVLSVYSDDRSCYTTTITPAPKVLNLANPDGGYRATLIWDEILGVDSYLVTITSLVATFTVKTSLPALKILLDSDTNYNVYVQALYNNVYGTASDSIDFNTGNPDYSDEDDICDTPPEVEAFYQDSNINNPDITIGTQYDVAIRIKNYDRSFRYEIQLIVDGSAVPVISRVIEVGDPDFNGTAVFQYLPFLTYVTVVYTFGNTGLLCDVIEPVRSSTCSKPINVVADNVMDSSFTVTWDGSANAIGYLVNIQTPGGDIQYNTTNTYYDFSGLTAETDYVVTIQAKCGLTLLSPVSDELDVTTIAAP